MKLRIVVADQSEARFFDVSAPSAPLEPAGRLQDPIARQHDRELQSDRPGRVFDHASTPGQRRGATAHHSTGRQDPRAHEAELFAGRIAAELERAHAHGDIERLVVMAGPRFLGLLREAMSPSLRALVVEEVHKDLVKAPLSEVRGHVSPDRWRARPV